MAYTVVRLYWAGLLVESDVVSRAKIEAAETEYRAGRSAKGKVLVKKIVGDDRTPSHLVAEALMLSSLYEPPPQGFQEAIRLGEEHLRRVETHGEKDTAVIHFYLACAYGQAHAYCVESGVAEPEMAKELRDNVLHEVRRAVTLDNAFKGRFANLLQPNNADNDFRSLLDDPALAELIS